MIRATSAALAFALVALVALLPLAAAQTEADFLALPTPMPCAMLSVYTARAAASQRDLAMTAACCAILERQALHISVRVPEACLDLAPEEAAVPTPTPNPDLLPECAPCAADDECSQGTCWGEPKKCTDFSWKSLKVCFQTECGKCRTDEQCSTRRCWLGRCTYKSNLSQVKCFPVHLLDTVLGR